MFYWPKYGSKSHIWNHFESIFHFQVAFLLLLLLLLLLFFGEWERVLAPLFVTVYFIRLMANSPLWFTELFSHLALIWSQPGKFNVNSKTPHVVAMLWEDSLVTILSPTIVECYKTVYLCNLDSYTQWPDCVYRVPIVSSHVVSVQLLTRCLVDRFLHRSHDSGYLITCVRCSHCSVVTVSWTRGQWLRRHSGSHS